VVDSCIDRWKRAEYLFDPHVGSERCVVFWIEGFGLGYVVRHLQYDIALNRYAGPNFLFPKLTRAPTSASLADRHTTATAIFTDPQIKRLPRTLMNQI